MGLDFLQPMLDKIPFLPYILMALGSLVVLGQCVVAITPSKKDDEAWEKIKSMPIIGSLISYIANFAPIQKK